MYSCTYIINICLIWQSNGTTFIQTIEELKLNIKVVDIVISDKDVKSSVIREYDARKFQSLSTIIVVYDLETYNKD